MGLAMNTVLDIQIVLEVVMIRRGSRPKAHGSELRISEVRNLEP